MIKQYSKMQLLESSLGGLRVVPSIVLSPFLYIRTFS